MFLVLVIFFSFHIFHLSFRFSVFTKLIRLCEDIDIKYKLIQTKSEYLIFKKYTNFGVKGLKLVTGKN